MLGKRLTVLFLIILGFGPSAKAQDPQFSQFYAAPLYLNPAFTGSTNLTRGGINYRNQWPAIEASFTTYSAYFDHFFDDHNSGVGMLLTQDTEGLAGLTSTSAALQYSYEVELTELIAFRAGVQGGYFFRSLNFGRLTFGDQFDASTGQIISPSTAEQFDTGLSRGFGDLSLGGVFFTNQIWLGVAWHHINRPQQSLLDAQDRLPSKLSIHGGLRFNLTPISEGNMYAGVREKSITPTFLYKKQGPFDQIDLGLYFTFEPIVLGTWYRGVPYKVVNGFANNESIVLLVGIMQKGARDEFNIGYSFDYTISGLGVSAGGAHEFTMSYFWDTRDPRKPPKHVRMIPCPTF